MGRTPVAEKAPFTPNTFKFLSTFGAVKGSKEVQDLLKVDMDEKDSISSISCASSRNDGQSLHEETILVEG